MIDPGNLRVGLVTQNCVGRDFLAAPVEPGWVIAPIVLVADGADPHVVVDWGGTHVRVDNDRGFLLPRALFGERFGAEVGRVFPTVEDLKAAIAPHVVETLTVRVAGRTIVW